MILFRFGPENPRRSQYLTPQRRQGMTLVELIVAISIVVLLAGLVIAFWPGVQEQQRAADGATMFESWLRQAKVRAFQNKKGAGLRLFVNPSLQVTQCQYVDVPDDFYIQGYNVSLTSGTITLGAATLSATTIVFGATTSLNVGGGVASVLVPPGINGAYSVPPAVSFTGGGGGGAMAVASLNSFGQVIAVAVTASGAGYTSPPLAIFGAAIPPTPPALDFTQGQSDPSLWAAQGAAQVPGAGDYLEVNGSGLVHLIASVTPNSLTVVSSSSVTPASMGVGTGSTFRVIRAPRVAGDEQLQLPANIIVDLNTNNPNPVYYSMSATSAFANPLPITTGAASFDILFSPAGTLITPGISTDFLGLWVRDTNGNDPFQLGPTIVAVWTRSGLIASHPPNDAPGGDPYQFVRDGRSQ